MKVKFKRCCSRLTVKFQAALAAFAFRGSKQQFATTARVVANSVDVSATSSKLQEITFGAEDGVNPLSKLTCISWKAVSSRAFFRVLI